MTTLRIKTKVLPATWIVGVGALLAASAFNPSGAHDPPGPSQAGQTHPSAIETAALENSGFATAAAGADSADPLARGQALFARQCVICHGEAGDGAGQFAYLMNPRPRNFKPGKFKLSTTQNQIPSDEDLLRTISLGMPGSAMPPWGHLPQADLKALVAYVRSIHVAAAKAELEQDVKDGTRKPEDLPEALKVKTMPGAAIVVPPEPPFDDLRWFNGRRVYVEACAACHGADGRPNPENVKFDDEGYPDPPRSFVNGIFKGGMEGPQLYCRIMKGMRGTPMPAFEGTYTDEDVWDMIHYVQSLTRNGAQNRAQLRQSTIVAPRIDGALPAGPQDPAWNQARPVYVAMTPLWWTDDRIEGVVVQALHNDAELALRLNWLDPTQDDRAVRVDEFRDAVAIQFSLSSDPPFYMGDKTQHGGVSIWMWKADREKNIESGYQDVDAAFPFGATDMYPECPIRFLDMSRIDWPHGRIDEHDPLFISAWGAGNIVADPNLKTPVETLTARGPGTLAAKPVNVQLAQGQAIHERGGWSVQLQRALTVAGEGGEQNDRIFKPGDYLPVSFAIWNGDVGDRDGKKNISIWQKLVVE